MEYIGEEGGFHGLILSTKELDILASLIARTSENGDDGELGKSLYKDFEIYCYNSTRIYDLINPVDNCHITPIMKFRE